MQNITNRYCGISRRGQPFTVVPLIATDALGNGALVAEGIRCKLGPSATAMFAAFSRAGCYAIVKGHGIRWMSGNVSPCFMERSKLTTASLYLYGNPSNTDGRKSSLLATLEGEGFPPSTWNVTSKGGGYLSFAAPLADEQADRLVGLLIAGYSSVGAGDGAVADARLGTLVGDGSFVPEASFIPSTDGATEEQVASDDKRGRGRPKGGKGGKRKVTHETAVTEEPAAQVASAE